jgi:hypothetical protein
VDDDGFVSVDEFRRFCALRMKSGTTKADVLSAFNSLASGKPVIAPEQIGEHFDEELCTYMERLMPRKDADYDYTEFTDNLFDT